MQKTEKYQFSIIEPDDDFSPDALNDNARRLEEALTEHEDVVAAALEAKADQSALNAARSELQAADTSLRQSINATNLGAKLFHVVGPVSGEVVNVNGRTDVSINLSSIGMSQYRALLFFVDHGGTKSAAQVSAGYISAAMGGATASIVWYYRISSVDGLCCLSSGNSSHSAAATHWTTASQITFQHASSVDVYGIKV